MDILISSKNYSQPATKIVQYTVVYKINIPIMILFLKSTPFGQKPLVQQHMCLITINMCASFRQLNSYDRGLIKIL